MCNRLAKWKGISWLLSFAVIVFATGCKKDTPLTPQEQVTAQLTSAEAWEKPTVTVDGVDYTEHFANFSLKFGKNTYTSTEGEPIWLPSGTWTFGNEEGTLMIVDGSMEVEIISINDEVLEISFQGTEDSFEPGRKKSIIGRIIIRLLRRFT